MVDIESLINLFVFPGLNEYLVRRVPPEKHSTHFL